MKKNIIIPLPVEHMCEPVDEDLPQDSVQPHLLLVAQTLDTVHKACSNKQNQSPLQPPPIKKKKIKYRKIHRWDVKKFRKMYVTYLRQHFNTSSNILSPTCANK